MQFQAVNDDKTKSIYSFSFTGDGVQYNAIQGKSYPVKVEATAYFDTDGAMVGAVNCRVVSE